MKKFSKIFAVLLTVCLLCGMVSMLASAAPAEISAENQLVIPSVGSGENLVSGNFDYNDYEAADAFRDWSGAHGLPNYAYKDANAIMTDPVTGNRYVSIRRNNAKNENNNGTTGYLEWKVSAWVNGKDTFTKNNMLPSYDYSVLDFEFTTDAYSVWVGYRLVRYTPKDKDAYWKIEKAYRTYNEVDAEQVKADIDAVYATLVSDVNKNADDLKDIDYAAYTESKISVDEALATKTLALADGGNFYACVRNHSDDTTYSSPGGSYSYLYTKYIDGKWYLTTDSAGTKPVCEVVLGEYVHITYIVDVNEARNGMSLHLFVNGSYVNTVSVSGKKVICFDSLRIQLPIDYKDEDIYSYCYDNLTVNYYEKGYNTGSVYGLDDYLSGTDYKTLPVYTLSDVVYNTNYVSPNGYVKIGDSVASINEDLINSLLETVKNDDVLEITRDVKDFKIPDGVESFTVYAPYGNEFTIVNEQANDYFVTLGKDNIYTIRKALPSEKLGVNWIFVDEDGNETLVKNTTLLIGHTPDGNDPKFWDISFDAERAMLVTSSFKNWQFDLDGDSGDVDLFDLEPIRAITAIEAELVVREKGGVLNFYSFEKGIISEVQFEYYIGREVDGNFVLSSENYDNFTNVNTIQDEIALAKNGDTLVFAPGLVKEFGFDYQVVIPAGMTLNVDLNGAVISRSANPTKDYVDGIFSVSEGSTLNLYSSLPNAVYAEAILRNLTENRVFSTGGIISVPSSVDECTINVNGENISFTGGTLFKFLGAAKESADQVVSNDKYKTINIKGGSYYSPFRSSYGTFCIQCPDVVINIEDASFYANDASYAIIHDYANETGKIYESQHKLTAKNSTFVSMSGDSYARLYYTMGAKSTAIFEDCTIIANLATNASSLKGALYFGKGNYVATSSSFVNHSRIFTLDGISLSYTGSYILPVGATVTHSNIPNRTKIVVSDGNNGYVYDESTEVFNVIDGKYSLNIDKILPENMISEQFERDATFVTFNAENLPDGVAKIEWYDSDDSVLSTTYAYPGTTVSPLSLENVKSVKTDSKWYSLGYTSWENKTAGADESSFVVMDTDVNVFKPSGLYPVADIDALMNMYYYSHFSVYLYLPEEDGISFAYRGNKTETSPLYGTGFFDVAPYTVAKSVNTTQNTNIYFNGEVIQAYSVCFSPEISDFSYTSIIVKFRIDWFDIDGDGVKDDGETGILLEQTFDLNDLEYAIKAAGVLECGSDEMNLIASFVRYKRGAYSEMVNGVFSEEAAALFNRFDAAIALHGEGCTCYTDYSSVDTLFTDEEKAITSDSYSSLAYDAEKNVGVVGISYTMNLAKPGLSIYLANNADYKYTLTVKYDSLISTGTTKSCTASKNSTPITLNGIECIRYECRSIPAEDINAIFYIKLVIKEGSTTIATLEGNYCLAEYIDNNPSYDMAKIFYDYSYQCLTYHKKLLEITESLDKIADKNYGVVIKENGTK